ncbi:MAG: 16S rRNA (guanine(966)-N(2))-methyltransferase RsmD [Phycisphaerales bacterium]|nr:16S rRNA (guanine(966)-N(2))-methyltransferase RsmD [Phycisphaerales bacterium]
MRIISGDYRRRQLFSPPGMTTRPIPDRVKEALFSMLGLRVKGATFLDCFAGSGAIGLEALSRGAASCLFVEKDRHSADTLEKNIATLGGTCGERSTLVRGDALGLSVVARCPRPLDLAFFDPPYPLVQSRLGWERVVRQCSAVAALLADDGFLMLRTPLPHMVTDDAAGGAGEGAEEERLRARRFKRYEKPRKGKWTDIGRAGKGQEKGVGGGLMIGGELVQPLSEEELEALAEGGAASGGKGKKGKGMPIIPPELLAAAAPAVPPVIADWTIPGARGPETHAYGTTAVHFYMKA